MVAPVPRVARAVFDTANQAESADRMVAFKARAAAAQTPADIWAVRDWLNDRQRQIYFEYDYRYSQPIGMFTRLRHKGCLPLLQLSGLSGDKLQAIAYLTEL
jgi:hypothetical protein